MSDLILEMPHKYHNNIVNVILIMKNNIFYFVIDVVYKGLLAIAQIESKSWPERH